MKNRRVKILVYGLYLFTCFGLFVLLFIIRDQFNWVASGLRAGFTYSLIGLTVVFLLITSAVYIKCKSRKILWLGLIGLVPCIIAIPYFRVPVFNESNSLNEKVETIELTYVAWACDCANWATKEDLKMYSDNMNDTLAHLSIFIEPANQSLDLPDTLGYNNDVIIFTGQFYKKKGFPQGYLSFEITEEARVFRYTDYKVVKSNYESYKGLNE